MIKTVAFKTIGCRLNQAETQKLKKDFLAANVKIHTYKDKADLLIINTCSVTHIADRKSRQAIREFRNRNQGSRVVVIGCGYDHLKDLAEVDMAISNDEKAQAFDLIMAHYDFAFGADNYNGIRDSRTRSLIKIQEGCGQFCTYCIIPFLRGRPVSFPRDEIVNYIKSEEKRGIKEIVLTGTHIGLYSYDHKNLKDLVFTILEETKDLRIRLSSIEPQNLRSDFLQLFGNERVCSFLHIPLQAGSPNILKKMGRNYSLAEAESIVKKTRSINPNICISTDIIVGFPGEMENDFEETFAYCKKLQFAKIHVFSYSKREGTKAAELSGHVSAEVIKTRSAKLRKLSDDLQVEYLDKFIGRDLEILTETHKTGISSEGIKVFWEGRLPVNQLVKMKVLGRRENKLLVKTNDN